MQTDFHRLILHVGILEGLVAAELNLHVAVLLIETVLHVDHGDGYRVAPEGTLRDVCVLILDAEHAVPFLALGLIA